MKNNYQKIFKIFKSIIERKFPNKIFKNVLIVGCGDGKEAIAIAGILKDSNIIAIDPRAESFKNDNCHVIKSSLSEFDTNIKFDLIYCYHTFEHITDKESALKIIAQLSTKDAIAIFGFPNRKRIIAYINPATKISFGTKIRYNLLDIIDRIKGLFATQKNNHLGISEYRFLELVKNHFAKTTSIRNDYYLLKYPKIKKILILISFLKLDNITLPSNYFICEK